MRILSAEIAIYYDPNKNIEQIEKYISNAKTNNFTAVFTSSHIPEEIFDNQIKWIELLSRIVKKYKMKLIVDISKDVLTNILISSKSINHFNSLFINVLRFDTFFSLDDYKSAINLLNPKVYYINASTLTKIKVLELATILKENKIKVIGSHNFYPREECGLSSKFLNKQNRTFNILELEVQAFVSSKNNPRGPIYRGLCTLERHRDKDLSRSCLEMFYKYNISSICIGDPYASIEELEIISEIVQNKPIDLNILTYDISDIERCLLFDKIHYLRHDNGKHILRLLSSREMASIGMSINVKNTSIRRKYSITIDNSKYKRYSGEIQITKKTLKSDKRVNVVGMISKEDRYKLKLIKKKSLNFNFREKKE